MVAYHSITLAKYFLIFIQSLQAQQALPFNYYRLAQENTFLRQYFNQQPQQILGGW